MVDRQKVAEWFNVPEPSFGCGGIIAAIVCFLIAYFAGGGAAVVFFLIGAAAIGVSVYRYTVAKAAYEARPSDQQMDEWLQEDIEAACKHSLDAMGIDESELVAEKVVITGISFDSAAADFCYRVGNDGVIRYTPVRVTIVNFGEHQLLSYQCNVDRLSGKMLNESTDEYFYKDVVSVSTKTDSCKYNISNAEGQTEVLQTNAAQKFMLVTSGGTSIEVVVDDDEYAKALGGKFAQSTPIEKAIQSIRRMLREKKAV